MRRVNAASNMKTTTRRRGSVSRRRGSQSNSSFVYDRPTPSVRKSVTQAPGPRQPLDEQDLLSVLGPLLLKLVQHAQDEASAAAAGGGGGGSDSAAAAAAAAPSPEDAAIGTAAAEAPAEEEEATANKATGVANENGRGMGRRRKSGRRSSNEESMRRRSSLHLASGLMGESLVEALAERQKKQQQQKNGDDARPSFRRTRSSSIANLGNTSRRGTIPEGFIPDEDDGDFLSLNEQVKARLDSANSMAVVSALLVGMIFSALLEEMTSTLAMQNIRNGGLTGYVFVAATLLTLLFLTIAVLQTTIEHFLGNRFRESPQHTEKFLRLVSPQRHFAQSSFFLSIPLFVVTVAAYTSLLFGELLFGFDDGDGDAGDGDGGGGGGDTDGATSRRNADVVIVVCAVLATLMIAYAVVGTVVKGYKLGAFHWLTGGK